MIYTHNVPFCDGDLKFNADSQLELYRAKSLFEKEPETIAWINAWSIEDNQCVFFDIGANIGVFSLYAAHKSKGAQVFCFEPVSDNYEALVSNIKLNDFNNVFAFNLALSNRNRLTSLFLSDLRVGNSGAQIDRAVNDKSELFRPARVEKVISFALDALVDNFEFPIPNYVKIDVDGLETDILSGMIRTLADDRLKSVLIEFNNTNELSVWEKTLQNLGLQMDCKYDNVEGHSRFRRIKSGGSAVNCIFSR